MDPRTVSFNSTISWKSCSLQLPEHVDYLEIGGYHGANVLDVNKMFGDVSITVIDPFENVDMYREYIGELDTAYDIFKNNTSGLSNVILLKQQSSDALPTLSNNTFDLIFIDGNHNPSNILEDAVLSYRKLRTGGYMIFDDYDWGKGELNTMFCIDAFSHIFKDRMVYITSVDGQIFLRKF